MMMTTCVKERNEGVKNTNFFSIDSLNLLKKNMKLMTFKSGDHIFFEGDHVNSLYYVVEGTINLYKATEDGKILTLNYFEEDDLFGDYPPNAKNKTRENAKALEDSVVGMIDQHDVELLLWEHRDFSIEFTKWVSHSQQLTQTKLRDLMFFGKNGAMASVIIRMTNTYGKQQGNKWEITKKFTHDEMSCLIGTPRETVTRMLSQLKKDGLIDYDKGYITVFDLNGLKNICRCEDCPLQICRL